MGGKNRRTNKDYLLEFTSKYSSKAIEATRLANVLDPAASYSGALRSRSSSPYDRSNRNPDVEYYDTFDEQRDESAVGQFINAVSTQVGNISQRQANMFGKVFRHQVSSGLYYSIYGDEMAKKLGDYNEMGNEGKRGIFKLDLNLIGTADLMNNAWGIEHMKSFINSFGEIENIGDFTNYLNYNAKKITGYKSEAFEVLNGDNVEFSSDSGGVQNLYNYFRHLKQAND